MKRGIGNSVDRNYRSHTTSFLPGSPFEQSVRRDTRRSIGQGYREKLIFDLMQTHRNTSGVCFIRAPLFADILTWNRKHNLSENSSNIDASKMYTHKLTLDRKPRFDFDILIKGTQFCRFICDHWYSYSFAEGFQYKQSHLQIELYLYI